MTWGEIRQRFIVLVGQSNDAVDQAWIYLTEGYRLAFDQLAHLPEVEGIAEVATVVGQDWVAWDCLAAEVHNITVKETARPVDRSPEGLIERQRRLDVATGKPPEGDVYRYTRSGNRIYLEGTPTASQTLIIVFRHQPEELTQASSSLHPALPPRYDMAIARLAAWSFFLAYPPRNQDGSRDYSAAAAMKASADAALRGDDPVKKEKIRRTVFFPTAGGYGG